MFEDQLLLVITVILFGVTIIVLIVFLGQQRTKMKNQSEQHSRAMDAFRRNLEQEKERGIQEARRQANLNVERTKSEYEGKLKEQREAIGRIRAECESKLREQREFIQYNRDKLSEKSEKELMIDALLALGGYASRLERIEDALNARRLSAAFDEVVKAFRKVEGELQSDSTTVVLQKISNTLDILRSKQDHLDLFEISEACETLENMAVDLQQVKDDIEEIKNAID